MADSKRYEEIVLGRKIGTCTGWDMIDSFVVGFIDFTPAKGVNIPGGDICVDYEKGLWLIYNEDGEVRQMGDLIEALKNAPRAS